MICGSEEDLWLLSGHDSGLKDTLFGPFVFLTGFSSSYWHFWSFPLVLFSFGTQTAAKSCKKLQEAARSCKKLFAWAVFLFFVFVFLVAASFSVLEFCSFLGCKQISQTPEKAWSDRVTRGDPRGRGPGSLPRAAAVRAAGAKALEGLKRVFPSRTNTCFLCMYLLINLFIHSLLYMFIYLYIHLFFSFCVVLHISLNYLVYLWPNTCLIMLLSLPEFKGESPHERHMLISLQELTGTCYIFLLRENRWSDKPVKACFGRSTHLTCGVCEPIEGFLLENPQAFAQWEPP